MRVAAALATLYAVWGSTYLAIRWIVEAHWPLLLTASARFALASALFLGAARLQGPLRAPAGGLAEVRHASVAAVLLFVVSNGLVMWGQTRVGSGLTALLVGLTPVWIAVLEALLGAWPTRPQVAGVVAGALGVAVLADPRSSDLDPWGAAALLSASVSWACGTVWSKRMPSRAGPLESAGWQMIVASAVLLAASLAKGESPPTDLSLRPLLAFSWLMLGGSFVGFGTFAWLLRNASPAVATTYAYVNPVVAALLGWWFAGETFGPRTLVAAALVLGGVAAITVGRPPAPAPAPAVRTGG
jgi:drug/metabolite transporter (DMT)-like permease